MGARRWTADQIEDLRKLWPQVGEGCAAWVGRSRYACQAKAKELGITYSGPHKNGSLNWTEAEDKRLRELWPLMGSRCASAFPRRTRMSVCQRASALRLAKKGRKPNSEQRAGPQPFGDQLPGGRVGSVFELGGRL